MTVALVLITLWLAIMALVVVACRMAASADRALHSTAQPRRNRKDEDQLRSWEEELLAPVEQRITMPQVKVYRGGSESAGLEPTTPEHVRHRSQ